MYAEMEYDFTLCRRRTSSAGKLTHYETAYAAIIIFPFSFLHLCAVSAYQLLLLIIIVKMV